MNTIASLPTGCTPATVTEDPSSSDVFIACSSFDFSNIFMSNYLVQLPSYEPLITVTECADSGAISAFAVNQAAQMAYIVCKHHVYAISNRTLSLLSLAYIDGRTPIRTNSSIVFVCPEPIIIDVSKFGMIYSNCSNGGVVAAMRQSEDDIVKNQALSFQQILQPTQCPIYHAMAVNTDTTSTQSSIVVIICSEYDRSKYYIYSLTVDESQVQFSPAQQRFSDVSLPCSYLVNAVTFVSMDELFFSCDGRTIYRLSWNTTSSESMLSEFYQHPEGIYSYISYINSLTIHSSLPLLYLLATPRAGEMYFAAFNLSAAVNESSIPHLATLEEIGLWGQQLTFDADTLYSIDSVSYYDSRILAFPQPIHQPLPSDVYIGFAQYVSLDNSVTSLVLSSDGREMLMATGSLGRGDIVRRRDNLTVTVTYGQTCHLITSLALFQHANDFVLYYLCSTFVSELKAMTFTNSIYSPATTYQLSPLIDTLLYDCQASSIVANTSHVNHQLIISCSNGGVRRLTIDSTGIPTMERLISADDCDGVRSVAIDASSIYAACSARIVRVNLDAIDHQVFNLATSVQCLHPNSLTFNQQSQTLYAVCNQDQVISITKFTTRSQPSCAIKSRVLGVDEISGSIWHSCGTSSSTILSTSSASDSDLMMNLRQRVALTLSSCNGSSLALDSLHQRAFIACPDLKSMNSGVFELTALNTSRLLVDASTCPAPIRVKYSANELALYIVCDDRSVFHYSLNETHTADTTQLTRLVQPVLIGSHAHFYLQSVIPSARRFVIDDNLNIYRLENDGVNMKNVYYAPTGELGCFTFQILTLNTGNEQDLIYCACLNGNTRLLAFNRTSSLVTDLKIDIFFLNSCFARTIAVENAMENTLLVSCQLSSDVYRIYKNGSLELSVMDNSVCSAVNYVAVDANDIAAKRWYAFCLNQGIYIIEHEVISSSSPIAIPDACDAPNGMVTDRLMSGVFLFCWNYIYYYPTLSSTTTSIHQPRLIMNETGCMVGSIAVKPLDSSSSDFEIKVVCYRIVDDNLPSDVWQLTLHLSSQTLESQVVDSTYLWHSAQFDIDRSKCLTDGLAVYEVGSYISSNASTSHSPSSHLFIACDLWGILMLDITSIPSKFIKSLLPKNVCNHADNLMSLSYHNVEYLLVSCNLRKVFMINPANQAVAVIAECPNPNSFVYEESSGIISISCDGGQVISVSEFPRCFEGSTYVASDCQSCAAGTYRNHSMVQASMRDCLPCPLSMYQPNIGSTGCLACTGETYTDAVGSSTCSICSTFVYMNHSACSQQHCPINHIGQNDGSCSACSLGSYAPFASSVCLPCSINTYTPSEGDDCILCDQPGFICNSQAIELVPGYWPYRRYDRVMSNGTLAFQYYSAVCPVELCGGGILQVISSSSSSSSSTSSSSSSSLSSSFVCTYPRLQSPDNILCGKCDEDAGFINWGSQCSRCDGVNGGYIVLALFLFTLLVLFLYRSARAANASGGFITVLLYFAQMSSLQIGSVSSWLGWMNLFNFNPSGFSTCLAKMDEYQQMLIALLTPLIMHTILFIIAALHLCMNRQYLAWRLSQPEAPSRQNPVVDDNSMRSRLMTLLQGEISEFSWSSVIGCSMSILLFSYTQVATTCIQFLTCTQVADDIRVVYSRPSMNCDSDVYKRYAPFVWFMLIAFIATFPITVLAFLWYRKAQADSNMMQESLHDGSSASDSSDVVNHQQHQQQVVSNRRASHVIVFRSSSSFLQRWGPLFMMYRSSAYYWQVSVLIRRLIFIILSVSLQTQPRTRAMAFNVLNIACTQLQQAVQPFSTVTLNRLETTSHVLLSFISAISAVYPSPYDDSTQIILFLLIVPFCIFILVCNVYTSRRLNREQFDAAMKSQRAAEDGIELNQIRTNNLGDNHPHVDASITNHSVVNEPSVVQASTESAAVQLDVDSGTDQIQM